MGGGGGGGEQGEPEFQVAPMIDVLLVMLIFFMSITTAQVAKVDKEIKLPVAPDAKKKNPDDAMNEALLNVRWDVNKRESLITFQDKKYVKSELDGLSQLLTSRHEKNDKFRVVIRGDKRLPAVEIQRVMALVGQTGISDISFSALNQ
jgi:biopolymer transport protein ExbD